LNKGVKSLVCRESSLALASDLSAEQVLWQAGSLAWTKVSHQSNTKSHAQGGNELCKAGIIPGTSYLFLAISRITYTFIYHFILSIVQTRPLVNELSKVSPKLIYRVLK